MNFATHSIGDQTSVASRFGTETGVVRPEKLLDVLCVNTTGGTLYLQIFDITNSLIPFGTAYSGGGSYTLTGLVVGRTYTYRLGANDTQFTNNAVVYTGSGTFVAAATTAVFTGTNSAIVTTFIEQIVNPTANSQQVNSAVAPAAGSTPRFSFPVQAGLGGTLGRQVDMTGIYCVWSSSQATLTAAGASGSIEIIIKG